MPIEYNRVIRLLFLVKSSENLFCTKFRLNNERKTC